jgi:hypothetical protein
MTERKVGTPPNLTGYEMKKKRMRKMKMESFMRNMTKVSTTTRKDLQLILTSREVKKEPAIRNTKGSNDG